MIGDIVVMEPANYEAWLGGGTSGPLADTGQKLFAQMGCVTCHRSDTQGRGPNLVGLFGKPVPLEDGRTLTADENFVRAMHSEFPRTSGEGLPAHHAGVPGTCSTKNKSMR